MPVVAPKVKVVRVLNLVPSGGLSNQATLTLHSSGDNNDGTTFTPDNCGIKQLDKNNVEMIRIWTNGVIAGDLLIVDKLPTDFATNTGGDNLFIGIGVAPSQNGAASNVGIGGYVLDTLIDGPQNTAVGEAAGHGIVGGNSNVAIGNSAIYAGDPSNTVLIGTNAQVGAAVTADVIAIGDSASVTADGRAVIGDTGITDFYIGSETAAAIYHGKGDAIVFPDADPHVAGAAYWVAGVLTKSAG